MLSTPKHEMEAEKSLSRFRLVLASLAGIGMLAALLFLPAGRLDWVAGWLYLVIITINMAINYGCLRHWNPDLIRHRMRIGKGTKTWDLTWMILFTPVFLAIYVVGGLDAGRFQWSDSPLWLWPIGLTLFSAGTAVLTWSMVVNPFFEKTVRIQTERHHRVIDAGPYRHVRHPGYLGFLCWILATPLLLGSWWAFVPSFIAVVALMVRTGLEDRTLLDELPGYVDYASGVRPKLIPGVW